MKIGDTVSIIDDDVRGKIISLDENHLIIEDSYGFSHRLSKKEVVVQNEHIYHDLPMIKDDEERKKISKKHKNTPFVLDLHFETLVKNPKNYEPWQRTLIQKEKLIETLEFCKENHLKRLTIIHGIGDGILQNIVLDILKTIAYIEYEDCGFFRNTSGYINVTIL